MKKINTTISMCWKGVLQAPHDTLTAVIGKDLSLRIRLNLLNLETGDSVWQSLFITINKKRNNSHAPSTSLSCIKVIFLLAEKLTFLLKMTQILGVCFYHYSFYNSNFWLALTLKLRTTLIKPLHVNKSAQLKIVFLISQPKLISWVLKRAVSITIRPTEVP